MNHFLLICSAWLFAAVLSDDVVVDDEDKSVLQWYEAVNEGCCKMLDSPLGCIAPKPDMACVWIPNSHPDAGYTGGYNCVAEGWLEAQKLNIVRAPPARLAPTGDCQIIPCEDDFVRANVALFVDQGCKRVLYTKTLEFLTSVIEHEFSDYSRISLAFTAGQGFVSGFSVKKEVQLGAIADMSDQYTQGEGQCTADILDDIIERFEGVQNTDSKMLVFFTDGRIKCEYKNICARRRVQALRDQGISVFIFYLGPHDELRGQHDCLLEYPELQTYEVEDITDPGLVYQAEVAFHSVACPAESGMVPPMTMGDGGKQQHVLESIKAVDNSIGDPLAVEASGYQRGQIMFWLALATFVGFGVLYYLKQSVCHIDDKYATYEPLKGTKVGQYNSV